MALVRSVSSASRSHGTRGEALSNKFASKKEEHRRFEGLDLAEGKTGAPLIPGALASIDCRLVATHDAGDHLIFVGEVQQTVVRDVEPLIYYGQAYGEFAKVG